MERQGYSAAEIAEALEKGFIPAPPAPPKLEFPEEKEEIDNSSIGNFSWAGVKTETQTLSAEEMGLTDEDVAYLRLKWGNLYKPEE